MVTRPARLSLEGGHPCFFRPEHPVELAAVADIQFAISTGEMTLDRLDRQIKVLSDLAV
jgi:hypothetical protein